MSKFAFTFWLSFLSALPSGIPGELAVAPFVALESIASVPQQEEIAAAQYMPGSELIVRISIYGPADDILSRFGHSAIWIHDAERGTDVEYNYGWSNVADPNLMQLLAMGSATSVVQVRNPYESIQAAARANRSVTVIQLHLSPTQRMELRTLLDRDVQVAERYRIDLFTSNCTTPIRDKLDEILGGQLRAATEHRSRGHTYRGHALSYAVGDPFLYWSLLLSLGSPADRPLTVWEEMFLPAALYEAMHELYVFDEDGNSRALVANEVAWYRSSTNNTPSQAPYDWMWLSAAGMVLGLGLIALGAAGRRTQWALVVYAVIAALWLLTTGASGMILAGLWIFSEQHISSANQILLVLHPLLLPLGWLVLNGTAFGSKRERDAVQIVAFCNVALAVLACTLHLVPGFAQANGPILAIALPVHLGMAVGLLVSGEGQSRLA